MNSRLWIVSYDNVNAIKELYAGFRTVTYNVGYTAREQRTGKEVMFFSPKLIASDLIGPVQQIGKIKVAA
jgi:DNA adenine methylase